MVLLKISYARERYAVPLRTLFMTIWVPFWSLSRICQSKISYAKAVGARYGEWGSHPGRGREELKQHHRDSLPSDASSQCTVHCKVCAKDLESSCTLKCHMNKEHHRTCFHLMLLVNSQCTAKSVLKI